MIINVEGYKFLEIHFSKFPNVMRLVCYVIYKYITTLKTFSR
jgi:hypothetical protein